jgi:hypothetical protein
MFKMGSAEEFWLVSTDGVVSLLVGSNEKNVWLGISHGASPPVFRLAKGITFERAPLPFLILCTQSNGIRFRKSSREFNQHSTGIGLNSVDAQTDSVYHAPRQASARLNS